MGFPGRKRDPRRNSSIRFGCARSLVATAVVVGLQVSIGYATDGTIDPTFGSDGVVVVVADALGGPVQVVRVLVAADGRITVAAQSLDDPLRLVLLRFSEVGELDDTFGNGGILSTTGRDISIQSSGAILVHHPDNRFPTADARLDRLTADGLPDPSFATLTGDQAGDALLAVAPDDSFFLTTAPGITKRRADGTIDRGFGTNGLAALPDQFRVGSIVVAPDSGLFVGETLSPVAFDLRILRLDRSGNVDQSFGEAGFAIMTDRIQTAFGNSIPQLVLAPGGRIIAAWDTCCFSGIFSFEWGLAAFTSNGAVDESFGDRGSVTIEGGSRIIEEPPFVSVDSLGRAIVSGVDAFADFDTAFTSARILRIDQLGAVDDSFTPPRYLRDTAAPIGTLRSAFTPDRRIVLAGTDVDLLLTRLDSSDASGCTGDCDGNNAVTISELSRGVLVALGQLHLGVCNPFDRDNDGQLSIGELVAAVQNAQRGC